MPYCSLFYHIVWSTKYRLPLIDPIWEAELYGYMRGKAMALECFPYAINGTAGPYPCGDLHPTQIGGSDIGRPIERGEFTPRQHNLCFQPILYLAIGIWRIYLFRKGIAQDRKVRGESKTTSRKQQIDRHNGVYRSGALQEREMTDPNAAGTGTVMRTDTLRRYAEHAGFSRFEVLPIEHFFFQFYRLTP